MLFGLANSAMSSGVGQASSHYSIFEMGSNANCLPACFVESDLPLNLLSFFSGNQTKPSIQHPGECLRHHSHIGLALP
jgi:hypothetical protein